MDLNSLFVKQPIVPDPNSDTANYIKQNEGYNPNVYLDTKKIPTTGYGFNLNAEHIKQYVPQDVLKGKRALSKEESEQIFGKVYVQAVNDAKTFATPEVFDSLTKSQKQALIDMSYNMGITQLNKFKNLREAMYNGDAKAMKREVLDSNYAKKDVPNRALRNANLMLK